jgi:SAM-dependent methyltransferase
MIDESTPRALIDAASAPYRHAGGWPYHHARGKLSRDPAFAAILRLGLLKQCDRILDLGCGQGLLAAWLIAARSCHARGAWPQSWPAPPAPVSIRGIELNPKEVTRARDALAEGAEFVGGDIRETAFGNADALVILDVLHYIDYCAHAPLLKRVHAALSPGGLMLLRVSDAEAGLRFRVGRCVDRAVLLARGHGFGPLYCRALGDWRRLLDESQFCSEAMPMSAGTPFANVLLIARPR